MKRPARADRVSAETSLAAAPALALAAALLVTACSTPVPYARGSSGPPGSTADATRGEYEVRCAECTVTYRIPGEGQRRERVEDVWRRGVVAGTGDVLSLTATVPEAGPRRMTTVRILVAGRVRAADTLRYAGDRRSVSVSYAVRGGMPGR